MRRFLTEPAILVYIIDIVNGTLISDPENPYDITLKTPNNEEMERVRLLGTVVHKYFSPGSEEKKKYTSLTVDDGTETIMVKGWEIDAEQLNEFNEGDIIEIIGKPRGSENDVYISSELTKKITNSDKEIYLRVLRAKRYLKHEFTLPKLQIYKESEDLIAAKEKVLATIQIEDGGIHLEDLLEKTNLSRNIVEDAIQKLIQNGDIYEPERYVFKKI